MTVPKPARGAMFIATPTNLFCFCFSAARRTTFFQHLVTRFRRAAEKQKRDVRGALTINMTPLAGFGHRPRPLEFGAVVVPKCSLSHGSHGRSNETRLLSRKYSVQPR